ncbi:MAG: hypothetical protein P8P74_15425 [Crocinitomicaceae bacterium]|nr:hypothetical protein [Crocinitomicaceae bacterium]
MKVHNKNWIKYRDKYKMDVEEWSGEKHHTFPVLAVYVIKNGILIYNYIKPNYSVRLKSETVPAKLKTI